MSRDSRKPIARLNTRQRGALELLAPEGTRAAKEDMAGAMSAFPWRINGTGRAIRTETLRQLERRGLVALADGEYRITEAGLQLARGATEDTFAETLTSQRGSVSPDLDLEF